MPERNNTRIARLARRYGSQPTMLDVLQDNEMHQNLFGQHSDELGLLRAARTQLRTGFTTQKGQIAETRRLDTAAAGASANERGVLGSSMDWTARQDISRNAQLARQGARAERNQGLISNWAQVMQSRRNYEMGVLGLQQNKAAARMSGNVNKLIEDLVADINAGQGYGRPGGRGNGSGDNPLADKNQLIARLIGKYRGMPGVQEPDYNPQGQAELLERLTKQWRNRNQMRKEAGMKALNRARLYRKLGIDDPRGPDTPNNPGCAAAPWTC